MKAIILLGTLKKEELSNTEILSEFLADFFKKENVDCSIVKLVNYNILPGTYTNMGAGDEWQIIYGQILQSEIVIFATPIWWNNQSSEIQKVIERLDEIHDEIMQGKDSKLDGKVGGIVITGDSDGAQNVISNISNFFNAIGIILPPFSTLSVLWEKQKKGAKTSKEELMKYYNENYKKTAEKMVNGILKLARK